MFEPRGYGPVTNWDEDHLEEVAYSAHPQAQEAWAELQRRENERLKQQTGEPVGAVHG